MIFPMIANDQGATVRIRYYVIYYDTYFRQMYAILPYVNRTLVTKMNYV